MVVSRWLKRTVYKFYLMLGQLRLSVPSRRSMRHCTILVSLDLVCIVRIYMATQGGRAAADHVDENTLHGSGKIGDTTRPCCFHAGLAVCRPLQAVEVLRVLAARYCDKSCVTGVQVGGLACGTSLCIDIVRQVCNEPSENIPADRL